jgi:energy-coupling factor transport system permease protein
MTARISYQPGSSFFHRLHPLVKFLWLVVGTAAAFIVQSPWPMVVVVCLLLLAFPLAGLHVARLRGTRLLASTALLFGLLQILFVHQGAILFRLGPVMISRGGVEAGVYVAGRFVSVVLLSYFFVLTTEPNDLAYALMWTGLPYRYGFALITALRLVCPHSPANRWVFQLQEIQINQ